VSRSAQTHLLLASAGRVLGPPLALLLASSAAGAHTVGLSTADFEVQPDGSVEAQLTFSSAEPLGGMSLDRDRDGFLTDADLAAAGEELRAFVAQGVEVDADGTSCAEAFRGASVSETDGLVLRAGFACAPGAEEIAVTLFYLSGLRRGHREVARLTAGENTVTQVLSGEQRAISLRLPGRDRAAVRHPGRAWGAGRVSGIAAALLAAGFIGWMLRGARRWRATRTTWQNRGS